MIASDSRLVKPGDTFVAIRGENDDGAKYIAAALAAGATEIVSETPSPTPLPSSVIYRLVPDTRAELARLAREAYGDPSRKLRVFGVTGTNGKTTVAHLIRAILNESGNPCALVSTTGAAASADPKTPLRPIANTTPGPLELQALFAEALGAGCAACAMEVSSHAIAQKRVEGVKFAALAFTNLTQDHLDYHKTMEEYYAVKRSVFFDADVPAAINIDDRYGRRLFDELRASSRTTPLLSYGASPDAQVRYENELLAPDGSSFLLTFPDRGKEKMRLRLLGRHNIENALCAFSLALLAGVNPHKALISLMLAKPVCGRLERVTLSDSPAAFFVDYAHTPDALENVLRSLRELTRRRLIVVFGAGGDRDRAKRPLMGEICSRLADISIVTSDNPRSENPAAIIEDIIAGCDESSDILIIPDRRAAIRRAVLLADSLGDVVIVAGKGHENYQIIGDRKTHFDDKEELENFGN